MKRKSTGKRLRFKVFERDGFTCQYCGKKPPEVLLHIDHIYPVAKGGATEIDNLITACADCNLGKSTLELGKSTPQVRKNADDFQERYEQLKAFYNLQKKMAALQQAMLDEVDECWNEFWPHEVLSIRGRASIKRFLRVLSLDQIKEAIEIASSKMPNSNQAFKYMCGILHMMRKESQIDAHIQKELEGVTDWT